MTDREFLMWIHERLEHVHEEHHLLAYMHKLRAIIGATPCDRRTANALSYNTLSELQDSLSGQVMYAGRWWRERGMRP